MLLHEELARARMRAMLDQAHRERRALLLTRARRWERRARHAQLRARLARMAVW